MTPFTFFCLRRHLERISQLYNSEEPAKTALTVAPLPACTLGSIASVSGKTPLFYRSALSSIFISFLKKFLFVIFLIAFRGLSKRERENGEYTTVFKPEISFLSFWWHFPIYISSHESNIIFSHYYSTAYTSGNSKGRFILPHPYEKVKSLHFLPAPQHSPQQPC